MANVTIRDVARQAGVGVGTVSRVLNQSPSVSEETRRKVESAIALLQYTPSPIARRLSLGKTMTIAVIAPFFIRPSYVERLRGVESVLAESAYDFIIYNVETVARRDTYFNNIPRRERIDGLLIMSLSPTDADVARFAKAGVETVLVDAMHPRLSRVVVDDVFGAYQATKHLIDLGHRKIAFISDFLQENPFDFRPVAARYKGYRQALEEAGIPFRPDYHVEGELSRQVAQELTYGLLRSDDRPTAVFAYSDTQAFGTMRAAEELDVKIPEELSVVGYDNIEIAEFMHLTTIHQHLSESGTRGAELLLAEMDEPSPEPREVLLPTELIIRKTTAAPATS